MQTSRSGYKLDNIVRTQRVSEILFVLPILIVRPQPRLRRATPKYTNCILTCVWADGKDWTPAMLFYNPAF